MRKLTHKMIKSIEDGNNVVLCTILASSGSSPRGAGARMAVFADGSTMSTVGGGRVELLAAEENSWMYLRIRAGIVEDFRIVSAAEAAAEPELFTRRAVYQKGEPLVYTEPLVRAGRVYLFGGGHVGQALVPVLENIDFRVTVLDNREALANKETFPQADKVIFTDFSNIYDKVTLTPDDYVVIMTPGHQADYEVLEQVLRSKTRYVGCIGSRHKIARTQQLLREAGISEEMIHSVHSPIGLAIGAETPAEIAISIAAEMIACRAGAQ